jgi:hypothetical protein
MNNNAVLRKAQQDFRTNGLAIIPQFLTNKTIDALVSWVDENKALIFKQTVYGNAYLNSGDKAYSSDHPLNLQSRTSLGVIANDQIPESISIKEIYKSESLRKLVADIVGLDAVYEYECPMGSINIAVMEEGDCLRWHFDQSDFVVSIPLRAAKQGGEYQFIQNLRSEDNENFEGIEKVLKGELEQVQTLEADAGSLVLFRGMHTLHRVTEIQGPQTRLVLLLSFVSKAGVGSSGYLREIRYGRTH